MKDISKMERDALRDEDLAEIQRAALRGGRAGRHFLHGRDKVWFAIYLFAAAIFLACIILLGTPWSFVDSEYAPRLQGYFRGGIAMVAALALARLMNGYVAHRVSNTVFQFNLRRIIRLLTILVLVLITVSTLYANWYSTAISLGLLSLVLGFALQTPISSFIGWIYILVRVPYRVGDRIQMGDARGDVIDVGYFDTTLWEIGGDYLSTDHPSGRIIKFPNTRVFSEAVFNYSWPLFPYIWNEIKFNVAYDSDLGFIETTIQRVAETTIGDSMREQVEMYRELLAETPVSNLDVREKPSVVFRVSDNTWLVVIVRYLVQPKEAGRVKTELIRKLLAELNAAPDKVRFPQGNAR